MSGTKSVSSGIKNIKLRQDIFFDDIDENDTESDSKENKEIENKINPLDL